MKKILPWIAIALLMMECAQSYRPLSPRTLQYTASADTDELEFSYRYDVFAHRGNRKYSKREKKSGFSVLAIKVTNKTSRPLNLKRDLELFTDRGAIMPADNQITAKAIRQRVPIYLLYLLLNVTYTSCNGPNCAVTFIPTGVVIAGINMGVAGGANKNMRAEFDEYQLNDRDLAPGETAHAIIAIPDLGFPALKMRVRQ